MNPDREGDLLDAVPVGGMRAVIARTMTQSLRDMAQLTLHRRVEVTPLLQFRREFDGDSRPSVNDLVLAAVARVLERHPAVNATLVDGTIFRWRCVHLGVAVAVDDGLVVPVIRNAAALSVSELRQEIARLAKAARSGNLMMGDVRDGTFTVTNLGAFGIDGFTPIINPPHVAILGVGRVAAGSMTLSLTIDHRALDGVPGARFLQDVASVFGDPRAHLPC